MVRFGKPRQGSKEVDNGADLVTDASAGLGCQELVETETAVEEERGAPIKTDDSADSVTDAPVEWRFQKAVERSRQPWSRTAVLLAAMLPWCRSHGLVLRICHQVYRRFLPTRTSGRTADLSSEELAELLGGGGPSHSDMAKLLRSLSYVLLRESVQ